MPEKGFKFSLTLPTLIILFVYGITVASGYAFLRAKVYDNRDDIKDQKCQIEVLHEKTSHIELVRKDVAYLREDVSEIKEMLKEMSTIRR